MAPKRLSRKDMLAFMRLLQSVKPAEQKTVLLSHLNDETCEALYETVYNILNNKKVKGNEAEKLAKRLKPHQKSLSYLARPGGVRAVKRKRMKEMGGGAWQSILQVAIPLLAAFI